MGKLIGVFNQKGGVGKSTILAHLALVLQTKYNYEQKNNFVGVYDSDNPQYSLSNLREEEKKILGLKESANNFYYSRQLGKVYDNIEPYKLHKGDIKELSQNFNVLRDTYDYTFVDAVGTVNTEGFDQTFLSNFDFIIIPINTNFEVLRSTQIFVKNIINPLYQSGNIGDYSIIFNDIHSRKENEFTRLKNGYKKNGYKVFDSLICSKEKYITPYIHSSNGSYSTLFPKYDKPLFQFVEEFLSKTNVEVL